MTREPAVHADIQETATQGHRTPRDCTYDEASFSFFARVSDE